MRLLIVGAGGHGAVVKEIAEATGKYEKIDFVDDNSDIAIGKSYDLGDLSSDYDCAVVSIGNNLLREEFVNMLKECGYIVPVLIHPTAYVSDSAEIGEGTIVEPKAIINANASIGSGCIISVGTIIDHNVVIEDYCHINSGSIVCNASKVLKGTKVNAGSIISK